MSKALKRTASRAALPCSPVPGPMSIVITVVAALLMLGCNSSEATYRTYRLPSGREVKVIGVTRLTFTTGGPALMLKYRTDLRIEEHEKLRQEVEEIWRAFRVNVEQASLVTAVISAEEAPKRAFLLKTNRAYNFVIRRVNGTWEFLDDVKSPKHSG